MAASVECEICPKTCRIAPGESGECRIRVNVDGTLRAVTYGFPSAVHIDPIEKKPLFHFKPASTILSIATVGCNLHCLNCQNWDLSQQDPEDAETFALPPEQVVRVALDRQCPSIAYTYSDPIVFYEYTLDTARIANEKGIANVLVTAGYGNTAPLRELYSQVQAANIDLKFFDDALYRQICDATLAPVLAALVLAKEMGVWLEVTYLMIPTLNDAPEQLFRLASWMKEHLGADTPLHLSRFHPEYRLRHLPPTPVQSLHQGKKVAAEAGLHYIYVGNVREPSDTVCPRDGTLLIRRIGYQIVTYRLEGDLCPVCHEKIAGVFT